MIFAASLSRPGRVLDMVAGSLLGGFLVILLGLPVLNHYAWTYAIHANGLALRHELFRLRRFIPTATITAIEERSYLGAPIVRVLYEDRGRPRGFSLRLDDAGKIRALLGLAPAR